LDTNAEAGVIGKVAQRQIAMSVAAATLSP
jgi:hypothetical protein